MHKTNNLDDGYLGSGKLLKRAITKHGIENFTREILFDFDNEVDMALKEAEIVDQEFVSREDTYNICYGGLGGFGFLNTGDEIHRERARKGRHIANQNGALQKAEDALKIRRLDEQFNSQKNAKRRQTMIEKYGSPSNKSFLGKKHTEDSKVKMRKSKGVGEENSQHGSMWITNGAENKKIKSVDFIPDGWYKGRKLK